MSKTTTKRRAIPKNLNEQIVVRFIEIEPHFSVTKCIKLLNEEYKSKYNLSKTKIERLVYNHKKSLKNIDVSTYQKVS